MKTYKIRAKIAEAIAIEQNTHLLANSLAKVAALRTGIVLSSRQREDGVAFIKAYVEYVPMLLDLTDQRVNTLLDLQLFALRIQLVEKHRHVFHIGLYESDAILSLP